MKNISLKDVEEILKELYLFNYEYNSNIDAVQLSFANESLLSGNVDSLSKLTDLTKYSYNDYHYTIIDKINNFHNYEVFILKDFDIDPNNLYQIIACNKWVDIFKFSQNDYDNKKIIAHFINPTLVYSFYDGSLIIIENDLNKKYDFNYKTIDLD